MAADGNRRTDRSGWAGRLATVAVAVATLTLPATALGTTATGRPVLTPPGAASFSPVLGDWEGTVAGFPISLQVSATAGATPRVAYDRLVALRPGTCPVSASGYREDILESLHPALVPSSGTVKAFGFGGAFTGRRTLVLSERYRVGGCAGRLRWILHPARRAIVRDGSWRLRFTGGQTARARVTGGGRVITGITLPRALTACNGTSGTVDLFIGPSGRAQLNGRDLRVNMRFGRRRASGTVNAGGNGCPGGPLRFTARLS